MKISKSLTALALSFARDCYSDNIIETSYGAKHTPSQLRMPCGDVLACTPNGFIANLVDYTVVQLAMLADKQNAADSYAYDMQSAYRIKDELDHEALIASTIAMGAGDRKTAIRWLDAA
jgi:hypothetical protein